MNGCLLFDNMKERERYIITQYVYEATMILEKNSKQRDVKM